MLAGIETLPCILRLARRVYTGIVGSRPIRNTKDIDDAVPDTIPARDLYLYASHPMSTCRMGEDPATAAVDPDGRLYGWDNLYVADASVFPTSLGVNPQVSTMAIGLTIGRRSPNRCLWRGRPEFNRKQGPIDARSETRGPQRDLKMYDFLGPE